MEISDNVIAAEIHLERYFLPAIIIYVPHNQQLSEIFFIDCRNSADDLAADSIITAPVLPQIVFRLHRAISAAAAMLSRSCCFMAFRFLAYRSVTSGSVSGSG